MNARRTIAATDRIFVEFTCNGELLGSELLIEGRPMMEWMIDGTADIAKVTLVRNEQNYKQWQPKTSRFEHSFEDDSPMPGENRYYLRVEQTDGNMA